MSVYGVRELAAKLSARADREEGGTGTVGFAQSYALVVHEDLTARHLVGQAKYLEEPLRLLASDGTLGKLVSDTVKGGGTMLQGIMVACFRVQREAQLRCPVATGALRASAFVSEG